MVCCEVDMSLLRKVSRKPMLYPGCITTILLEAYNAVGDDAPFQLASAQNGNYQNRVCHDHMTAERGHLSQLNACMSQQSFALIGHECFRTASRLRVLCHKCFSNSSKNGYLIQQTPLHCSEHSCF